MDIEALTFKVADFGHSRQVPNRDVAQTLTGNVGTPLYRAPEVNNDDPEKYSSKADIYSIGLMTMEMLCGGLPRKKDDKADAKEDLKVGDSLPKSISDEARKFVSSILDADDPSSRPTAKMLLADDFIKDPDRKETVTFDCSIRGIACTKSHVVIQLEDGTSSLVDSRTKKVDKKLTTGKSALASYEDSFALASSEDTVKIWTIEGNGSSLKLAGPKEVKLKSEKDDNISWLGLSEHHVLALFERGTLRAKSWENPHLKEWNSGNMTFTSPLHLDLDNKQEDRSFITAVFGEGRKIRQYSIIDRKREGGVSLKPISPLFDLQDNARCIAWGDDVVEEDAERVAEEGAEFGEGALETNAEHSFVYLSYGSSEVVLLDLQDKKKLREVSLPYGHKVIYISFGMSVLFCVVDKGEDRWIVAYEQQDIRKIDQASYMMMKSSPFRIIAKLKALEDRKEPPPLVVGDTEVVFAVGKKLHFLDKAGIMAKPKTESLG